MSLYNNLMKSGFLSKAEEELEEARIVIDKHVENFEDQGLWYFSQEDKEEDFDWLMAEIDGYDVLEEEFEDIINDDVFAIRGYEAGIDFTLMWSVSVDIINKMLALFENNKSSVNMGYYLANFFYKNKMTNSELSTHRRTTKIKY